MKETERIAELFEDIYDGDPWLGVSIMETLNRISPAMAAKKTAPWNSIWQIVHHMIRWRQNVLQRVHGKLTHEPPDNYMSDVTDPSETAWQNMLKELKESQEQWTKFLQQMNEADLAKIYPGNNSSYYKNIHGILQHDAYHLGQLVLLVKALQ